MIIFMYSNCTQVSAGTGTLVAIGSCRNILEKNRAKLLFLFMTFERFVGFFSPLLPLSWVLVVEWQKDII